MEGWQLKQRQSLPLEAKINMSLKRIREWYEYWEGQVYISFSGGKDSTVLLHLVRSVYPDVPAVFVDTGLEYPEIRQFVRTVENVVWLRPKIRFDQVINQYGYPVFSKEVARAIRYAKKGSKWAINNFDGLNPDGSQSPYKKGMFARYKRFLEAPFKISDRCCEIMKEQPCYEYGKATNNKPFIGLMATESKRRENGYLKSGCNAFDLKKPRSLPLSFWIEKDILHYLKQFNVPYSKVYGEIIKYQKSLFDEEPYFATTGAERTGCMFCGFGVHLDESPNRFQRMKRTHPAQYKYCMEKLGLAEVLDYIKVPH